MVVGVPGDEYLYRSVPGILNSDALLNNPKMDKKLNA